MRISRRFATLWTTSFDVLAEPSLADRYTALTTTLGYEFSDLSLLHLALTHRSFCAENGNVESNERLEFLGDSVLGLVMTDTLFIARPEQSEGDLAKARAEVVSAPSLADTARRLGIGDALRLGRGEELSGGRDKESILADAMEAVIAAVYLDGGWEQAKALVNKHLSAVAFDAQTTPGLRDYKTRLQERAAELSLSAPDYEISSTGPDHDRIFNAKVLVGGLEGVGSGSSKKQAQQNAAGAALMRLQEKNAGSAAGSGQDEQAPVTVPNGGTQ